jgi:hypothetical protein
MWRSIHSLPHTPSSVVGVGIGVVINQLNTGNLSFLPYSKLDLKKEAIYSSEMSPFNGPH